MTGTTAERAREILVGVRGALEADGYGMSIEPADAGIHITVTATGDACAECLVPVEVFEGIISSALEKDGLTVEKIEVTYPTVAPH